MDITAGETLARSVEEEAASALQALHNDLRLNLTTRVIQGSTDAVVAVEQLTELHTRTVKELNARIDELQKQLSEATGVIEGLGTQLVRGTVRGAEAVSRSLTVDVLSDSFQQAAGADMSPTHTEHVHDLEAGELSSDAFATAVGSSSGGGTGVLRTDTTFSSLSADVSQSLKLQQKQYRQQQSLLLSQVRDLTVLLERVVKENVQNRKELQLLRVSTIPIEQHQQVVEARDMLLSECSSMKIELHRLHIEMEKALQSTESPVQPSGGVSFASGNITAGGKEDVPPLIMHESDPRGVARLPQQKGSERDATNERAASREKPGFNEEALLHPQLWKVAVRELEQQATLAASQLSAADSLREAESCIAKLKEEREALRDSYKKLEEEDKCVRADCEQLTFRNAVLSQQLASLLVRVEHQCRSLHRLSQRDDGLKGGMEIASGDEIFSASSNPAGRRRCRGERGRVAAAVHSLLEQRGAVLGNIVPQSSPTGGAIESHAGHVLDVASPHSEPLEIEGGLRTAIGVFAQTPRHSVRLRNLGSPPVTLEATQLPRLPTCEELSGVALGRPSSYATLYPSQNQAHIISGVSNSETSTDRDNWWSSGASVQVISENDEENARFLEVLREDESLDRFSVNSVGELIKRNQELVQQLYLMSQRVRGENKPHTVGTGSETENSSVTSDTEAAKPREKNVRKRRRESTPPSEGEEDSIEEESFDGRGSNSEDDNVYQRLEDQIQEHINAVLAQHEAHLSITDKELKTLLARISEIGREFNGCNQQKRESVDDMARDRIIASLVRLCVQQSVRAAEQTASLVEVQKSSHNSFTTGCWLEAQRVLKQSTEDLCSAVSRNSLTTVAPAMSVGVEVAGGSVALREVDEATILQNIAQLLRAASLREHAVQRVLALAAQRLRTARRVCSVSKSDASRGQRSHVVSNEETDEVGSFPGDVDDYLNDSASDEVQYLREQMDIAHAQYSQLLETHHEERKQHTVLLDKMWRLEEEMVSARREREDALQSMSTMMKREDYEATVAALDDANTKMAELEWQLQQQKTVQKVLEQELDAFKAERVQAEQRCTAEAAQRNALVAQKDELIAHYASQQHQLEHKLTNLQASNARLEEKINQERGVVCARDEELSSMREKVRRLELALLENQPTQELLLSMFPDDRMLELNSKLILEQCSEKENLMKETVTLKLDLDSVRMRLEEQKLQTQQAIQARQEAELLLQEKELEQAGGKSEANAVTTAVEATETQQCALVTHTAQLELESLRRANALLLLEKKEWMEREVLLRDQLDALGRDPVSENARRYGLEGVRSFEEQLVTMQGRCDDLHRQLDAANALRTTVKQLTDDKGRLTNELREAQNAFVKQQQSNERLREEINKMTVTLQEKEESHDAAKMTLAEKEEIINSISEAIGTLEAEIEKLERSVTDTERERDKLLQDNIKLIESVKSLTEAVKKKEGERKAAQAALAQGLASATASSNRWRGRGSSLTPVSVTGSLATKSLQR
uniref:Uncharacterized protein n=1 Tax=Trypanosoma congolense (strain IL3000) TaxID=1068625 RepID=G0UTW2_TRYCI|nr:conserved hypothetical protein [Trypanosoma congolense IL3000]